MKISIIIPAFNSEQYQKACLESISRQSYFLRPSCYKCIAKDNKMSDITIADFWGIDLCAPEMNDGKGTSLVIVRTAKGDKFFADIKEQLCVKEVSYKAGVKCNLAEYRSALKPAERNTFFVDMRAMCFETLARKYAYDIKEYNDDRGMLFRLEDLPFPDVL